MGQVVIHRGRHYYMGIFPWRVFVDGKVVGKVANGKDITIDVPAGKHEMQVGSETIVHLFLYKWLRSNKLLFEMKEDDSIELNVQYHSLWNFGYRRPELFVPRESMVLLPTSVFNDEYYQEQALQKERYNNVFLKAVRNSKIDILIHILYLLFFVSLLVFAKDGVAELYTWLGLNTIVGIALFRVYKYDHHLSIFGLLSSATILMGYDKSFPLVGLGAVIFFALFVLRFINRYKHFKQEVEIIKKEDSFLGEFNMSK